MGRKQNDQSPIRWELLKGGRPRPRKHRPSGPSADTIIETARAVSKIDRDLTNAEFMAMMRQLAVPRAVAARVSCRLDALKAQRPGSAEALRAIDRLVDVALRRRSAA